MLNTLPLQSILDGAAPSADAPRRAAARYGGAVAGSDAQVLELAGREVRITSPGKVLFAERGETKLDLVRYYAAVAEPLHAHDGRPAGAHAALPARAPAGRRSSRSACPTNAPEWLRDDDRRRPSTARRRARWWPPTSRTSRGRSTSRCLGFHVWPLPRRRPRARRRAAPRPRPAARAPASPRSARRPRELKALLDELGIAGYPKTTGNRGLHVYVRLEPRWDSYEVRSAAVAAARELERRRPDILTAAWWKEERGERIFVDYNQNAPHKTVFGAWSVRARPGAQVSTPIALGGARRRRARTS